MCNTPCKRQMKRTAALFLLLIVAILSAPAQALWISANANADVSKRLALSIEGEWRSTDKLKSTDRYLLTATATFKLTDWLSTDAGYMLLIDRRSTSAASSSGTHTWENRHRGFVSLIGGIKAWGCVFTLRERYQATTGSGGSATRHELRSRIEVKYAITRSRYTPYASFELRNNIADHFAITKSRLTIGTTYRIDNHNTVGAYYRHLFRHDNSADDANIIGMTFSYHL